MHTQFLENNISKPRLKPRKNEKKSNRGGLRKVVCFVLFHCNAISPNSNYAFVVKFEYFVHFIYLNLLNT